MTQTFAVQITRTVVDGDPMTYVDRTRFEDPNEADAFAAAVARQGHVLAASVVGLDDEDPAAWN